MDVILEKMDGQVYAMNPEVEKIQGQNYMKLVHSGCTHVLLLYAMLDEKINFMEENTKTLLKNLKEDILTGDVLTFSDSSMKARIVDYVTIQKNRGSIQLPEIAANYAICACRYNQQDDSLKLYLPDRDLIRYQTTVSVEVKYKVEPYEIPVKKGFLGICGVEMQRTDFYKVLVGTEKSNFSSGDIVYTIDREPWKYPVTEEMKGREVLIKSGNGNPRVFQRLFRG